MTAHPKIDPATGAMHFFGYDFAEPYLVYHVADRDGTLVSSQPVAVKASTMIHDFAITEHDVVFWEMPVLFDMNLAIKMVSDPHSSVMPYVWKPEYGSRIGVMPLGGPASAIRWVEIDPCYVFHGMNAWREGDDVVLDVCRMPTVFSSGSVLGPPPRLHRWRVDTSARAADVPRRGAFRPRRRSPVDRPALRRPPVPARLAGRDPPGDRRRRVRGRGAHRRAVRNRDPLGSRLRRPRRANGCSSRPAPTRVKAS